MNRSPLVSLVARRWRVFGAVMTVTALAGGGVLLAANSDPATALAFHTVPTTRLLDTRPATQVGTRSTPLGLQQTMDLVIAGLPDDATAVNLNVTVVDGTEGSFLTLYATGDARPPTSTINWLSAAAVANTATVSIHAAHSVTIFNLKGTVDVVIDLLGYYAPSPAGNGPPGAPGKDAQTVVKSLTAPWAVSNPSVVLTPDGVAYGPYADGGADGGSLIYHGMDGQPMSSIRSLVYYARYVATNDTGGVGVPYLRIFTNGDTHDAIFSPNTQTPDPDIARGPIPRVGRHQRQLALRRRRRRLPRHPVVQRPACAARH